MRIWMVVAQRRVDLQRLEVDLKRNKRELGQARSGMR